MKDETIDEGTGELIPDIPVRDMVPMGSDSMGVAEHRPTTLLDYSALMMAARAHPRDVNHALKTALSICTLDETTAKDCVYALPRGGKKISGPSIGLAQTLAACYGNMNVTIDSIQVMREEGVVELRGFIMDTETGLTTSDILRRSIKYGPNHKTKPGELFDDDMIGTTTAAARSILWRNLVLRIIPRPLVTKLYKAALLVSTGDGKSFTDRQQKCVTYWEENFGVDKSKLLHHLGHTAVSDLNIQDFEYLLGLENAIKQRDTTIEDIFKKDIIPPKPGEKPKDLDAVTADLKAKAETTTPEEPEMPEPALTPEQEQERQGAAEQSVTDPPSRGTEKPVTASTSEPEQTPETSEPPAIEEVGMPGAPIPRPKKA